MKQITQEEGDKILGLFDEICILLGETPISQLFKLVEEQLPVDVRMPELFALVNQNIAAAIGTAFSQMNNEMAKLINNPALLTDEQKKIIMGVK